MTDTDRLAALLKALQIGAASFDGDGWFASDAGLIEEDDTTESIFNPAFAALDAIEAAGVTLAPTPPDALPTDEAVLDWLYERGDDQRMADAYQLVAAALAYPKEAERG